MIYVCALRYGKHLFNYGTRDASPGYMDIRASSIVA